MREACPSLSVVVPLYNEGPRVTATARAILEALGDQGLCELILVDDGSRDDSGEQVRALAAADPRVRGVAYGGNRGKGYAVRMGMLASMGAQVLFTDADLSTPIGEIAKLRVALAEGADVAIGSRALDPALLEVHQPAWRERLGRAANGLLRSVDPKLRAFSDTQCGFKLLKGDVARLLAARQTIERWGFDFELLHMAVKWGLVVREIPVRWAHSGSSSLRRLDYLRTLADLGRVLWNDSRGRY